MTVLSIRIKDDMLNIDNKMILLEEKIKENCISYLEIDELYLVFNYNQIEKIINDMFSEYDVSIINKSEVMFILKIEVKEGIFYKSIEEKFYLKKGDLYEKFN
jgi:hypothetical protein